MGRCAECHWSKQGALTTQLLPHKSGAQFKISARNLQAPCIIFTQREPKRSSVVNAIFDQALSDSLFTVVWTVCWGSSQSHT